MLDHGKKAALSKKSYELAYAIFRVASLIKEREISDSIKSNALKVLEFIVAEDYEALEKPILVLDYVIKLTIDVGMIGFANGEILSKELTALKMMVAECMEGQHETVDLAHFFSRSEVSHQEKKEGFSVEVKANPKNGASVDLPQGISSRNFFSEEGIAVSRAEDYQLESRTVHQDNSGSSFRQDDFLVATDPSQAEKISGNNSSGSFLKSGMRQIAILDKIRKSGNCRMRDIQEILPDSSERTIRYDLEALIERKLIERTGNGGPSVAYRIRQV